MTNLLVFILLRIGIGINTAIANETSNLINTSITLSLFGVSFILTCLIRTYTSIIQQLIAALQFGMLIILGTITLIYELRNVDSDYDSLLSSIVIYSFLAG
jgi:hypothetical protein